MKFHHAKRGLSVLLVLCMLLTALPSGTFFVSGGGGAWYPGQIRAGFLMHP